MVVYQLMTIVNRPHEGGIQIHDGYVETISDRKLDKQNKNKEKVRS